MKFLFLLLLQRLASAVYGMSLLNDKPLSELLQTYSADIQQLRAMDDTLDDVALLRYCFVDDKEERNERFQENLKWRQTEGKSLWEAAQSAVAEATENGGWDNDAVLTKAPYSSQITQFLTPDNCLTTTSTAGDLVSCIRAGAIDDVALMSACSVDQVTDFFVYSKLVNSIVANQRSLQTNQLVGVLLANDLKGVKLVGGSADFRSALSASSKKSDRLIPGTGGPTLLLNLPGILSALVKLFKPLFPPAVAARLKFCQGPLSTVSSLRELVSDDQALTTFRKELDDLVYS